MKKKLTKEQEKALQELTVHNRKRVEMVDGDQNEARDVIEIPYEEFAIYDVYYDEMINKEVNPVEYYGYEKIIGMIEEWELKKEKIK